MKEIIKKAESGIFYLLLYAVIYIQALINNTIDMDYWARLLQGNAFIELGHILKHDSFSYTQTHTWIDHEWGSGVIFSFIQNNIGFDGILFFRALIVFLIFFFIFRIIKLQITENNYLFNILFFSFALFSVPTLYQSGLRCHFFTFLFFTIFLYVLEISRKKDIYKPLIVLPLIMLIWCNCHGGCVSGLGLLILYATGQCLNKKSYKQYIITLLLCFAVMFINPYGVDYIKFIFMAVTMQRPFVTEWISPFYHPAVTFMLQFKIFYILNIIVLLLSVKKIKNDYTKYIVLVVCAYLSFRYVKNTPFFVIAAMSFLYEDFLLFINKFLPEKLLNYTKKKQCGVILLFLIFVISLITYFRMPYVYNYMSQQPVKVTDFIARNSLTGKIVAPFDYGSYLAYKRFPDNLIYMDGRYEEVYYKETKDLLDDFLNVKNDGYKILEDNPELVIIPADALVNDYMKKLDNYKLIYSDEKDLLYAYKDSLKDNYINTPLSDENSFKIDLKSYSFLRQNFKFTDEIYVNGEKVIFK